LDCDWYDPVRYCLQACADKPGRGGIIIIIIIIDDYHDYGGYRTAVDESIASRPDFVLDQGRNPFLRKR
jgi:asparagine synthase (glutamine-hydrolysing)